MHEQEFYRELEALSHHIPSKYYQLLISFFDGYRRAVLSFEECLPTLFLYLLFLRGAIESPHVFEPYHKKIRHPLDYYQFGLDFIRPLIDFSHSRVVGHEELKKMREAVRKRENVVLLANHQTESDPQVIAALLEKEYGDIGESIIYVAGERVITDPLAIPFSMGCDLLCIYSKRYIDHPPDHKEAKQLHNKKTMQKMSRLLEEGGKVIYVAPSGGRDRKNSAGVVEVAPFDADSIEMFYLMAKKAKTPTHFIPMALATYDLLPPPERVQVELGEVRLAKRTPVHIGFSPAFDMECCTSADKHVRRCERAEKIWKIVCNQYQRLIE